MADWINFREERDFGEKFNATFLFARQNFKNLSLSLLLLAAPINIALIFFYRYYLLLVTDEANSKDSVALSLNLIIMILIYSIATSWLMTLTYSYINEYLEGNREIAPVQLFKKSLDKIGNVFIASVITTILILIACLVLFIPGIFYAVGFSLVSVIIVVEGKTIFKSISRSVSLIRGKWWSTFGMLILISMLVLLMQFLLNFTLAVGFSFGHLLQQGGPLADTETGNIFLLILTPIGLTFFTPLIYIAIAFQYFNLVERKESLGLKQEIYLASNQTDKVAENEGEY
jgi:hypothetical protein